MVKKACKQCKRLILGDKCPICKSSKLNESWKGRVIVINPEKSEIAKKVGATDAGEYALR